MKQIILKESALFKIKDILEEGAETKNMRLAKHYLYDNFGYDEAQAMNTIGQIKTDIPNVRLAKCKFILGVTRMFFQKQLNDGDKILRLNRTLKYIASDAHINEYNNDLNGENVDTLIQRFSGLVKQDMEAEKQMLSQKQYTKSDYTIVKIPNFKTARKYAKYVTWCITEDDTMYASYTHGGLGLFYFCLKNGFENVEEVEGENCPLDEYGLSMIAVSVNNDGSPNTITCRWNHDNNGNDNIMTPEQLSDVIGYNFYDVFKPYSEQDIAEKMVQIVDEIHDSVKYEIRQGIYDNVKFVEDIKLPDASYDMDDDDDFYNDDDYDSSDDYDGYNSYDNEDAYKYSHSRFVLFQANNEVCENYGWYETYKPMEKFIIYDRELKDVIIDRVFDDVNYCGNGIFTVMEGKKVYTINENGENVLGGEYNHVNVRIIDENNMYAIVMKTAQDNSKSYHNIINLQTKEPLFYWDNDLLNLKWFTFKPSSYQYKAQPMVETIHNDGSIGIYKLFNDNLEEMIPSHKYQGMKVFNEIIFMGDLNMHDMTAFLQMKDYTIKQFTKEGVIKRLQGHYGLNVKKEEKNGVYGTYIPTYGVSTNIHNFITPNYYLCAKNLTIYKKDENGNYIETNDISV